MDVRIIAFTFAILVSSAVTATAYHPIYEPITVTDGGAIKGVVTYEGTPPVPATIAITKDVEVCGHEKRAANLIVGPDKGIQNAVVRLTNVLRGKPLPKPKTVTVSQKGCEYSPRVAIFPAGSRIRIENEDGILHNTNVTAELNRSFSLAQPKFRRVAEKRIEEPEMPIRVRCDVHSWMGAWWISQEHPYYALTDAHGAFTLTDVPPGTYTLEAWHETLGRVARPVAVTPNGTLDVHLEMTKR